MGEKEWIRWERITLWGSNSITRASSRFTPGRLHQSDAIPRVPDRLSARQSLGNAVFLRQSVLFQRNHPKSDRNTMKIIYDSEGAVKDFSWSFIDSREALT